MSAGTAYAKRYGGGFLDTPNLTTPADSTFLNAVETVLLQLMGSPPTADGQVAQWDNANTRFGPALILNKNIDPAAAIDKSKLNLAGQIGNADIAGAAAIARSKLNFGSGLVDADIAAAAAISPSKIAANYSAFTPTLSSSGGGGALGNAIASGRYLQIGKFVHVVGRLVLGTTTNFGSGQLYIGYPVTPNTSAGVTVYGTGYAYRSSTGALAFLLATSQNASYHRMTGTATFNGTATDVSGTSPFPWTWATGDELNWHLTYEAA